MHLIVNIFNILVYLLCEFPREEMSKYHNSDYQEVFIISVPHHPWLRIKAAICTALALFGATRGS